MKIYLRAGIYSMYYWSMLMYFMPNQRRVTPVDLVILSERAEWKHVYGCLFRLFDNLDVIDKKSVLRRVQIESINFMM